jgi:N-acetylmuramoyl-L-alanine amidase
LRELFLLFAVSSAALNLYPRYDGVVLEVVGGGALRPETSARGMALRVDLGVHVDLPGGFLPMWIDSLATDSLGFTVFFDEAISTADWALGRDSMAMIVFARAGQPVELPTVAWQAPPPPPDTTYWSDSLMYEVFAQGGASPWMTSFECVVIDPGHGGRDPGAVGPLGTYEKDRALEIALMVRDLLAIRMPELRVVLTRSDDRYVSLGERTRMANRNRADLFVSIHCNAAVNREAHGFETFYLSRARTDEARAVELLENQVIDMEDVSASPDDPLSFLLADMAQSIFLNQSSHLAGIIQKSFGESFPGRRDRGVKTAGFYVLRGAYMPAVLVEVGFISNPSEERQLLSLDFRFRAAQAIVESIVKYAESEL